MMSVAEVVPTQAAAAPAEEVPEGGDGVVVWVVACTVYRWCDCAPGQADHTLDLAVLDPRGSIQLQETIFAVTLQVQQGQPIARCTNGILMCVLQSSHPRFSTVPVHQRSLRQFVWLTE